MSEEKLEGGWGNINKSNKNKDIWHGYLHISGSIITKPIICTIGKGSKMVKKYIPPFELKRDNPDISRSKEADLIAEKYIDACNIIPEWVKDDKYKTNKEKELEKRLKENNKEIEKLENQVKEIDKKLEKLRE